ncbi:hypothetical protein TWF106_007355 [Orbilia oligospora]|uniref:C2H2-type domain-containing protein n=1 Tax=Orbilia oligospora TaxID=2813651 RepID=A0A7C8V9S3_ORBOL|nr:hypothetical protein TWF106_007355 [Orbilia oligospora]
MDLDSNGSCDESDDSLDTNDLIEDIETSLARLSHLGTMIRKYSTTSRSARIRSFAEQSNLSAFENLARLVVDTLYPGANESLRIQLARSMFETCASVLYKRSHQQKMNTPRLIQEPRVPTVNEEPQETAPHADKMKTLSISDPLSLDVQKSPHRANQIGESTALESVPSALDSLRTKVLKKMLDSPSKIESDCGISSVQVGKVTYPRPPQTGDSDYRTCEWCLKLHPRSLFEDTKHWSAHIDKDFEPYVCLSESCMNEKTLPCYATFREWLQHMNTVHTTIWQQEIHKPVFWACSFQHSTQYFNTLEELHKHMKECYPDKFATGLYTIAKNSHIKRPRSRKICPLCCRELANNKGKNTQVGATSRKRRKIRGNEGDILNYSAMPESQESSVDEQDVESPEISMARHIAEHLQVSMFLTIRLIRCQSQDGESIKCEESRVVDSGGRSTTISRSFSSSWVSSPRAATMRRCSPHPIFTATDNFDESASGGNQKTTYYDDSDSEQDHLTAWENDLLIKEGDEWEWEWGEQEGREEDQTLKKKDEVFGGEGDGLEKEVEASQAVPGEASSRYSTQNSHLGNTPMIPRDKNIYAPRNDNPYSPSAYDPYHSAYSLHPPQTNSPYPGEAGNPRHSAVYTPSLYDPSYTDNPYSYSSDLGHTGGSPPSAFSVYPIHRGFTPPPAPTSFGPNLDRFGYSNSSSRIGEDGETDFSLRQVRCIFYWINCRFKSSSYEDWVKHIYFQHFPPQGNDWSSSGPNFGRAPTVWKCRYRSCYTVIQDGNHKSLWDQKTFHIFGHLYGGAEPEEIQEDRVWLEYYKSMRLCYEVDVFDIPLRPPPR